MTPLAQPNDITFVQQLINLIPVLAGGIMGFGGSIIAAYFSHKLQKERQEKDTNSEHLEQILSISYETLNWSRKDLNSNSFGGDFNDESPEYKLKTLCGLYFPSLNELVYEFILACGNCYIEARKTAVSRLSSENKFPEADKLANASEAFKIAIKKHSLLAEEITKLALVHN